MAILVPLPALADTVPPAIFINMPSGGDDIVPWLTFAGVVLGAIATFAVASRNRYITSITAERSKWLDKLRINIAAYNRSITLWGLAVTQHLMVKDLEAAAKRHAGLGPLLEAAREKSIQMFRDALLESREKGHALTLQLNTKGEIDKNLIKLVNVRPKDAMVELPLLTRLEGMIIAHSRWLLKVEWERVKLEASGPLYRWRKRNFVRDFLIEYDAFCEKEGLYEELLQQLRQSGSKADQDPGDEGDPASA